MEFVEPHLKKQELTPLPQIHNSIGSGTTKMVVKGGMPKSTRISGESGTHTSVAPDAMTWANTWGIMNTTVETFATKKRNQAIEMGGGGQIEKNPQETKGV